MNRKSFLKTIGLVAASPTIIREVVDESTNTNIVSTQNVEGNILWIEIDGEKIPLHISTL